MIHAATHSSGGKAHKGFETVDDVSKVPGARQPMVRTHPETGKKSLFLGRRINAYVIGLPVAESEALLDELLGRTWSRTNSPGARNGRSATSSGGTIAARCTAATPSTRLPTPPDAPHPVEGHAAGLTNSRHCEEPEGAVAISTRCRFTAAARIASHPLRMTPLRALREELMPHPSRVALDHRLRQADRHRQFDRAGPGRERRCRRRLRSAPGRASPTNSTRPATPTRNWGGVDTPCRANHARRAAPRPRRSWRCQPARQTPTAWSPRCWRATAGSTSSSTTPARRRAPTATRSRTCRSRPGI